MTLCVFSSVLTKSLFHQCRVSFLHSYVSGVATLRDALFPMQGGAADAISQNRGTVLKVTDLMREEKWLIQS